MTSSSSQETARQTPAYEEQTSDEQTSSAPRVQLREQRIPERVGDLSQQAADVILERAAHVRERALVGFEQQRNRAADTLERLSHAFDFVGAEVQRQDESMACYLERTGKQMRDVAAYVASASPADLTGDLASLARSRPAAVVGGSFVMGAVIGRFLRATRKTAGAAAPRVRTPSTP